MRFGRRGNGRSALLQAVRAWVRRNHVAMNMVADGQAVAVPFGDAVRFEVRPAFSSADGSFTCPDSNVGASRKRTDPKSEIQGIRNRNEDCSRTQGEARRAANRGECGTAARAEPLAKQAPDGARRAGSGRAHAAGERRGSGARRRGDASTPPGDFRKEADVVPKGREVIP
ncbi:MAG: hypothetical protein OXH99_08140 [Bryobacterales bacterium]|nr:hypothetical protein [Bryobacterales bacterium]